MEYSDKCSEECTIKQESIFENTQDNEDYEIHDVKVKTEEALDIKDELIDSYKSPLEIMVDKYKTEPYEASDKGYKNVLVRHIRNSDSNVKMHICEICNFRTKYIDNHMLMHNVGLDAKIDNICDIYSYETRSRITFKRQFVLNKTASELHRCVICNYETECEKNVKTHMLTHTSEAKVHVPVDACETIVYKCEICNYEARDKKQIKRHSLVHMDTSEVKIYRCEMCAYRTKYSSNVKRHMQSHKNVSDVKIYKCGKCTFETRYRHSLKKHSAIHTRTVLK